MSARGKARLAALELLFEGEARGMDPLAMVADREAAAVTGPAAGAQPSVRPYTKELLAGVAAQQQRIDELLSTYSTGWALDRMPAVDRAALRLGAWELLFNEEVPDAVVIDEAASLAAKYSTDNSPKFVSGLLNRLKDLKPALNAPTIN